MKLWATIKKDIRILWRDRMGMILMFAMPVILVIVVALIQNNTFDLLSKKKVPILIVNHDTGLYSKEFIHSVDELGMFKLQDFKQEEIGVADAMRATDVLIAVEIPADFSKQIRSKANQLASKALTSFGLEGDSSASAIVNSKSISLYYKPEIQPSFKLSIEGAINSSLQKVQSRQVLKTIYFSINEKPLPDTLEKEMLGSAMAIEQIPVSKGGAADVPNATQHNVPAWTIFAMFFVVMSLGSSVVREKNSGSFQRLKTLPTNYMVSLMSKQLTYLTVTLLQAAVVFLIGWSVFPLLGLPALNIPADKFGLIIVTLVCGWCAVSYAICVGVFAKTQEQANGFGAVSIVILAMLGGLMVPSFAMPETFRTIMKISPLHWCLQSYYGLFLEGGRLKDVFINIIPILIMIFVLQLITFAALKKKNLI